MRRTLGTAEAKLLGMVLLAALPSALIASRIGGTPELILAVTAMGICTFLAAVSVGVSIWALPRGPQWQLGVLLGGPLVRMALSLSFAVGLILLAPGFPASRFLVWILVAYLVTLVAETAILAGILNRHAAGRTTG